MVDPSSHKGRVVKGREQTKEMLKRFEKSGWAKQVNSVVSEAEEEEDLDELD